MIADNQLPDSLRQVIDAQVAIYKQPPQITVRNHIPDTKVIPLDNPKYWLKIPDVICLFVDMKGSTQFSATTHDKKTANAYQLFTETAVRLFHEFDSSYIDLKGDGVLALFNSDQPYTAFAAAITFKTFAQSEFVPKILDDTGLTVGSHLGIDQKTVLVRKLGLKRHGDRTDRQNEVWAGKPVNMASKLSSMSENNELLVSERFFKNIQHELVLQSCGCPDNQKNHLWSKKDVSEDSRFDFETAYSLTSNWCKTHGKEYCEAILALDAK